MDAVLLLAVIACFVWLMARRGAFRPAEQPDPISHNTWPVNAEWDPHPAPSADYSPERDGWPADDSPYWRLGRGGRPSTGGDGMMSVGGFGGDSGGGGAGGC